uniref:GRIP domain-containing protein n=1 Tax=Parastrongyloides trichosuri TaxID=131310 RepID=A0A0N4ZXQ6_PARTI
MTNPIISSSDLSLEVEKLRQSEANLSAQIRKMTEEHNYDNKRLKEKINSLLNCVNEGKLLQQQVTYLQNSILTAEKEKNEALGKMRSFFEANNKKEAEIKDLQEKYSLLLSTKTDLENQLKVWIDKCCAISMESGKDAKIGSKEIQNGDINLKNYQNKYDKQKQIIVELENNLKLKNADIAYKEHRLSQILGHIDLLEKEKEVFMKERERFTTNVKLEELEHLKNLLEEKCVHYDQLSKSYYVLQEKYNCINEKCKAVEEINTKNKLVIEDQLKNINEQSNLLINHNSIIGSLKNQMEEKDIEIEKLKREINLYCQNSSCNGLSPTLVKLLFEMETNIDKLSYILGYENNSLNSSNEDENCPQTIYNLIKQLKSENINNIQKSKVERLEKEIDNLIEKLLESENKSISLEMSLEKLREAPIKNECDLKNTEINVYMQNVKTSQNNNYDEIKKPSDIPLFIWEKINNDKDLCLFLKHQQERLEHLETENDSMHEVYQLFFRKLREDLSTKVENVRNIVGESIITEILQNDVVSKSMSIEEDDNKNVNEEGTLFTDDVGKIIEI